MAHPAYRRILVFRAGALGDLLLAAPALFRVRRTFPEAEISLVARSDYAELLATSLSLEKIHDIDTRFLSPLFLDNAERSRLVGTRPDTRDDGALERFLGGFDLIISWLGDERQPFAANVRRLSAAALIAAAPHPPPGSDLHAADYLVGTLASLGLRTPEEPFRLELPPYIPQTCDRLLSDSGVSVTRAVLAVHPGSGGMRKCWPVGNFITVARRLARMHKTTAGGRPGQRLPDRRCPAVLWLLGPAERERADHFSAGLPEETDSEQSPFVVMSSLPVMILAGLLDRASLYVGNDSGVSHLAGLLGTPSVVLFGPTSPGTWAPRGEHVRVLAAKRLEDLGTEQVLSVLEELWQA